MIKIGFLGPRGTFSQEALEQYAANKEYTPVDFNSIPDILNGVEKGIVDEAVVPVESSLEGSVNATLDMLSGDAGLKIKNEIVINISQNLLVKKGTSKEQIKRIYSHPQPVGQCRQYISRNFPGVEIVLLSSTSASAKEAAKGNFYAAIASLTAAKVYGLEAVEKDIQDVKESVTRFLIVSKNSAAPTGNDKTSIVFSTEDKPGSLYRVLDIFNLWDINMTRIESRPSRLGLGKYIFFVDIQGHMEDEDVRDALTMVKRKTSFLKLLGSYPRFEDYM